MLNVFLPAADMSVWAPGIALLGLFVGFLTGMFGVGGGFILTPFLKIIFGVPYPVAVGSDLLQIFVNSSVSSWRHWVKRSVDLVLGSTMALGAICGTETGVRIMHALGTGGTVMINGNELLILDLVMNFLFLILMSVVGFSIWRETSKSKHAGSEEVRTGISKKLQGIGIPPVVRLERAGIERMSLWVPFCLSFCVGILTGLMGVGGGFVNFPLMVYILGVPTLVAVGTSAFQIVFASAYGAFRHGAEGHVELILVGLLLVGSIIGVQIGVRVSHLFGGRKVRKYFAVVLLLGITLVVWDLVRTLL